MAIAHDPIRVLIGEFDEVTGAGLSAVLGRDSRTHVVGRGLAEEALRSAVSSWSPHVVVLAHVTRCDTVERMRGECLVLGVLIVAADLSRARCTQLFAAGANCVSLAAEHADVVRAVHQTAAGERFFIPSDGLPVKRSYPTNAEPLTTREREVFCLVAQGASYQIIAADLDMGLRTAETHVARIRKKLGVRHKKNLLGMHLPSTGEHQST
jgi:DNA-binding NarL/FixJ family response regulator